MKRGLAYLVEIQVLQGCNGQILLIILPFQIHGNYNFHRKNAEVIS